MLVARSLRQNTCRAFVCGSTVISAFRALADKGINIKAITTSEIKISILIDGPYAELAVRTLHSAYGLDKS